MIEQWRDIPGFPGYQVSDLGAVRSLDREIPYTSRAGRRYLVKRRGYLLKLKVHKKTGYVGVEIASKDQLVHRLVLLAFVGPCPPGHEGAHGDGVRTNNAPSNLRYATRLENAADRHRHGTTLTGEQVFGAKLNTEKVAEIRALKGVMSQREIAAKFNVTYPLIGMIHRGKIWNGQRSVV